MDILIVAASAEDARRIDAALDACGLDDARVEHVSPDALDALPHASDRDVVLTTVRPGAPVDALARAFADDPPILLLADALDEDVAAAAGALGARVCLFSHGPRALRPALVFVAKRRAGRRAMQDAVAASEKVRALVNVNVADVVFHLRVEGDRFRFLEANPAFMAATGLREEQVVGKFVDEVIPEPSRGLVLAKYREAIEGRHTVRWIEVTEYPTGTKYGEVSATPVLDARGACIGLVGTVHDATEERVRGESLRRWAEIVDAVQIALTVWDARASHDPSSIRLVTFNPAAERAYGLALAAQVGRALPDVLRWSHDTPLLDLVREVARDGVVRELAEVRLASPDAPPRALDVKVFPLPGGSVGLASEDVTERARARALNAAETRVLEQVAAGAPLEETLATLALEIEQLAPPALASILLLSPDGRHVLDAAGPHLPVDYRRAIDGAPIGPAAGSCGTAAALRKSVVVTDIESDPLWDAYRDLARRFGLRACWSTPILSGGGRVLGTFALYYRAPRSPTPAELGLIERATHVADIAIQRRQLDDQLRALTARIEAAREEERAGIAREIHDQLGQSLTAIKMDLAWIARKAQSPDGLSREALLDRTRETTQLTSETIDLVRRISAELRPGVLDDLGLGAAIRWQAQEFEKRTGVPCEVRATLSDASIARDLATTAFRTFQEALTNVARHAEAKRVEVDVEQDDGFLDLRIRDDGKGIRPEHLEDPRSLGLLGIRERARRMGGSASFAAVAPSGTLVTVRLPVEPRSTRGASA